MCVYMQPIPLQLLLFISVPTLNIHSEIRYLMRGSQLPVSPANQCTAARSLVIPDTQKGPGDGTVARLPSHQGFWVPPRPRSPEQRLAKWRKKVSPARWP